jgi:hypothetical protein
MGLDGLSFDEDEDALREMRLAYVVHKASGSIPGCGVTSCCASRSRMAVLP